MSTGNLLVRDVRVDHQGVVDVLIVGGRIAEIGRGLRADAPVLQGRGGALLPGLHDHHIHLLGLAAHRQSLPVGPPHVNTAAEFGQCIEEACGRVVDAGWVRATGYDDGVAGPLDRHVLDRLAPDVPVRVQYRTGTLWVLNSAALARVLGPGDMPGCVECDAAGVPTGRVWDGDHWLRARVGAQVPPLAPIGALLAQSGVTGVTDASATTGPAEAALLADAHRGGALPQRLCLMSGGALVAPADRAFTVGPVKIHLHEARLPDLAQVIATIGQARRWSRCVAFHCVTATELAFAIAALQAAGVAPGDRIEHGAVVDDAMVQVLAELRLTVVTQPAFIAEKGDRYLQEVAAEDLEWLYPCARLLRAGVSVAGSSDAPYASPDPWAAIATAQTRRTRRGRVLGDCEVVTPQEALALFLAPLNDPGGPPRRIAVGAEADLCLLHLPLAEALRDPRSTHVRATVIAGRLVHDTESTLPTNP